MSWEAPPSGSLTIERGLQGASVPVRDPWITGYVVERREFRARADGYLYFPEPEDTPIWSATMTVGSSTTGTPATGYFGAGSNAIWRNDPERLHPFRGLRQLDGHRSICYQASGELRLRIQEALPLTENLHHSAFEDWVLVVDGRSFPVRTARWSRRFRQPWVEWPDSGLSWSNGQRVSVQLVERELFEWERLRRGRDGDTSTSFTDNEQANGRKFVYRIMTANTLGVSTNRAIFDWLFDSPYRDAVVDLAATDTTTDDGGAGDGETNTGNAGDGSANNAATGAPTISGTPQVGETLTASTSGITDEDGLTNVSFRYQWLAGGSDIAGATGSTYTLTASEQGQTIQVRVTFTDDADNEETLTSEATAEVTAAPVPLTASLPDSRFQSARHKGADDRPQVIVAFSMAVASFEKTTPSLSLTGAAVRSVRQHEEDGLDNAWIFFLDPDGSDDIVFSLATGQPCDSGGICAEDGTTLSGGVQVTLPGPDEEGEPDNPEPDDPNSPATGAPTIGGTPQVEETLTADTADIADQDGLTNVSYGYQWTAGGSDIDGATGASFTLTASQQGQTIQVRVTFTDDADNEESLTSQATVAVAAAPNREATGKPAIEGTPQVEETLTADTSPIDDEDGLTKVSYRYQWIAGGLNIDGATGSTHTLTATEQGQTIQVRVTFTDDRNNAETLTSIATTAVAAAPEPLTVRLKVAAPATHNGSSEFTFEIEFSEEFGISYATLRDHAFNVTGGSVETAQRTDKPSNIPWLITIKPQGNGDVTIELPATTDCNADGAICTGDGRKLSNSLSFTVSGPGQ